MSKDKSTQQGGQEREERLVMSLWHPEWVYTREMKSKNDIWGKPCALLGGRPSLHATLRPTSGVAMAMSGTGLRAMGQGEGWGDGAGRLCLLMTGEEEK